MSSIADNLIRVASSLPEDVKLVAVSKFHPAEQILEAYNAGQRLFGESRVPELLEKQEHLPKDISWHFIGHVQTNKLRRLIGHTTLIESVDSERLINLIEAESMRAGVLTDVLLQLHVAREETKFGFAPDELLAFFDSGGHRRLQATRLRGVMAMASNTDDEVRVKADFTAAAEAFDTIRRIYGPELPGFDTLSMGMSDDRDIAIACGSNMVRVGTAIFGPR